uniref:Uncharacterized protein n=1 Tax=Quercus lobata TaxID=97700 RepID=A0A7N2LD86_QUELO
MVLENMFNLQGAIQKILQFRTEWLQLDSSCLWEHASIVVQLGFYAIILVHLARNFPGLIRKNRRKVMNRGIDKTVKACALTKDFELFSCGDLTEIGERGINMSGGQKQRIQIARAAYQDADIYLLDDPFSAVDAHTGTQLLECLMGILKEKTILFVTHQVEFLPAADLILVMQNGRIAQAGRFEELMKQKIGFEVLVGAHSQALDSILSVENSSRTSQSPTADDELNTDSTSNAELLHTQHDSEHNLSLEITEKGGKLVQDEEREKGSIGKEVYWSYLTVVKGGALVPFILLAQSSFQILQVASNYWMAWASPPTSETEPKVAMDFISLVYVVLAVGSSLCVLARAVLVAKAGLWTAEKLFTNMLHSIFRAPMAFFDSTPFGRILNRQYYIPTARELARLAGIQRAPILHHFAESLSGAATIRAFDQQSVSCQEQQAQRGMCMTLQIWIWDIEIYAAYENSINEGKGMSWTKTGLSSISSKARPQHVL